MILISDELLEFTSTPDDVFRRCSGERRESASLDWLEVLSSSSFSLQHQWERRRIAMRKPYKKKLQRLEQLHFITLNNITVFGVAYRGKEKSLCMFNV